LKWIQAQRKLSPKG